jgi:hypothetical protein
MSSSKSALERTISTYNKGSRVIRSSDYELTLISDENPSLRLESNSGILEGGFITLESGSSSGAGGGGISLLTGTTDQTLTYRSGDLSLKTGDSSLSGYVWIQSGDFPNADYSEPSFGEVHVVSKRGLSLRSGGDIVLSPMPYNTYSSTSGGSVTIAGQGDTLGSNPGLVRVQGGDQAVNGSNSSRAGAVYIDGGKSNSGVEGSDTWGGDIFLTSYGYGSIESDANSLYFLARGVYSVSTTTRDSNDDSAFIYLSTGDGADGTSTSGDISIKTGSVTGTPTSSETSDSGDVVVQTSGSYDGVVGSITLTTGSSVEGVVGDIEITTGDLTSSTGTAGSVNLQGGTGSNNALAGSVNIIGGGVTSVDWVEEAGSAFSAGDVTLSGGDVDSVDGFLAFPSRSFGGSIFLKGGDGGVATNGAVSRKGSVHVSDAHTFNVTTDEGSYFNAGSTFSVDSPQIVLKDISISGNQISALSGANVHLDPDGEVEISSASAQAGAENLLLALGSDSILKTLGISLLGTGTVSFTIPPGYHVNFIPLFFFSSITYNDSLNDIPIGADGHDLLYATVTETYTGVSPLSSGVLSYPNLKVLATVNSDSNLLEVESGSQLVTTPLQFSPNIYYLELRYAKAGGHEATDGISNKRVGNGNINVKVHYLVFA